MAERRLDGATIARTFGRTPVENVLQERMGQIPTVPQPGLAPTTQTMQTTAAPAPQPAPQPHTAPAPAPTVDPNRPFTTGPTPTAPQADPNAAAAMNPELMDLLFARARGEGLMSLEERLANEFDPFAARLNSQFEDAQAATIEDLISRGVVRSGEAVERLADQRTDLADIRSQRLGEIFTRHEEQRQQQITQALNSLGILEGNRVQAKTTITAANLQAASDLQRQLLQSATNIETTFMQGETARDVAETGARAQVRSSKIAADSRTKAAQIGAQAALQAAGMDFNVAMSRIEQQYAMEGIDSGRFESDPVYRDAVLQRERWKDDVQTQVLLAAAMENGFEFGNEFAMQE